MKQNHLFVMMAVATMLTACEKQEMTAEGLSDGGRAEVTFTVSGDWQQPTFTRGSDPAVESVAVPQQQAEQAARTRALSADGKDMTDLWVLDYVDGSLAAQVHQSAEDDDFGRPQMALSLGTHHLYFVASRGADPTLSTADGTITWAQTRDTFWKHLELTVTQARADSRSVTLDRVTTRLHVAVTDEIPETMARLSITPETWYYGLDYRTGEAVASSSAARIINVPASYVGTSGRLSVDIYGLSDAEEWTTGLTIAALDGSDGVLSEVAIADAPFQRNRTTNYSGCLFAADGAFAVSLADEWSTAADLTW